MTAILDFQSEQFLVKCQYTSRPRWLMQRFSPKVSSVLEKMFKGFYHIWSNVNIRHFSNFGRPPVPNDLCKDSAPRHPRFWRRRFLKVFTIYGHGGHLGQRAETILAIFYSPNLKRLHMKFEQNWLRGSRGEVVWNSEHFSHTNA